MTWRKRRENRNKEKCREKFIKKYNFELIKLIKFSREQVENKDLAKSMLTKKNRRILQRIEYGKEKKRKEAEKLETKAQSLKKNKQKNIKQN